MPLAIYGYLFLELVNVYVTFKVVESLILLYELRYE